MFNLLYIFGQADKEKREAEARIERFDVGEWVAAIYCEVWWVGQVVTIMENLLYAIKFMHPVEDSCHDDMAIDFPEQDDITEIHHDDIICVVSEPTPDMYKSKFCKTLPKKEIKNIQDLFEKML